MEDADLSFRQAAQFEEDSRFREITKYFEETKHSTILSWRELQSGMN